MRRQRKFLCQGLKTKPDKLGGMVQSWTCPDEQRRHAEAIQSFEKSLLINPGNKDAFNNAGICYMSLRNYSQAVKCYERAMALGPQFFLRFI